ncbi:MAG: hypothetical protein ACI8RD_012599 [Bacillariaceae sp.]|jgi:hypothetical protein
MIADLPSHTDRTSNADFRYCNTVIKVSSILYMVGLYILYNSC